MNNRSLYRAKANTPIAAINTVVKVVLKETVDAPPVNGKYDEFDAPDAPVEPGLAGAASAG